MSNKREFIRTELFCGKLLSEPELQFLTITQLDGKETLYHEKPETKKHYLKKVLYIPIVKKIILIQFSFLGREQQISRLLPTNGTSVSS